MSRIPPKKLKAFAEQGKKGKKGKRPDEEDEREEDEDDEEREERDEKGEDEGGGEDGAEEDETDDEDEEEDEDDAAVAKFVHEEGKRVNDGKHDGQLKKLMAGFDPEENPPAWVGDEAKWDRAKEAVDPEGDGEEKYDDPWAVVAHVYKRMGGKIKGGGKGKG